VEPYKTSIARQRLGKHVPAATNTQTTIEIFSETMFSARSMQRGYKRRELRFGSVDCSSALQVRLRRDGSAVQETVELYTGGCDKRT
jgi:hypothetical protein